MSVCARGGGDAILAEEKPIMPNTMNSGISTLNRLHPTNQNCIAIDINIHSVTSDQCMLCE